MLNRTHLLSRNRSAFALTVLLTAGLQGCGGSYGDSESPSSASSSQQSASSSSQTSTSSSSSMSTTSISSSSAAASEGATQVYVDSDVTRAVGDADTFHREAFITLHASHTEQDWWLGENADSVGGDNLMAEFVTEYDVYFGRDTGGMAWQLSQVPEDPEKPGYADDEAIESRGNDATGWYSARQDVRGPIQRAQEHRNQQMIVAAQQHPYWPNGTPTGQGWTFSQTDTPEEPLGTATGQYMSQFLKHFFRQSEGEPGQPKPLYVEVMNEPLWELVTVAEDPVDLTTIFEFHNTVAKEVRALNPDVLLGGYTVAFPDFEKDNFNRWEERDKHFLDVAGSNMDFISLHLYDFPDFTDNGVPVKRYRKGANMEATLDMLNHYTDLSFGKEMPLIISEYGAQVHRLRNEPWFPYRDWLTINSINSMMMAFMERPHQVEKALPFITVKAEWGRISPTVPYNFRLMRQQFEAEGESGEQWVYTELVKLYELWKDVGGTRLDTATDDPDLRVDAYRSDTETFIIVNNLDFETQEFALNFRDGAAPAKIQTKQLFLGDQELPLHDRTPMIENQTYSELPQTLTLESEATMVIRYSNTGNAPLGELQETNYYANTYKQPIESARPITFEVDDINTSAEGFAILRVGLGREHGLSLQPEITVNGEPVTVPTDWRGGDQYLDGKGRESFFGVIEVPLPVELIDVNNTVRIKFPDSGGYVSSLAIRYGASTTALLRPKTAF
ncbi:agarase [Marinimicrobium agarilyticum]|uniref:agarase n=1 Tax=Marinimicrobium agarilyticum TaxID=306546 RepID=UPI00041F2FF9|nr:agarase [Marinimicrobium agarilyticum]